MAKNFSIIAITSSTHAWHMAKCHVPQDGEDKLCWDINRCQYPSDESAEQNCFAVTYSNHCITGELSCYALIHRPPSLYMT